MTRRRLLRLALRALAEAGALGLAVYDSLTLASYGVPVLLNVACGLAVAAALLPVAESVTDLPATRRYRCRACSFRVRVRAVDAVEARRWQETAADHPRHRDLA